MIDESVNLNNLFIHNVSNFIGMDNFAFGNRQWFL